MQVRVRAPVYGRSKQLRCDHLARSLLRRSEHPFVCQTSMRRSVPPPLDGTTTRQSSDACHERTVALASYPPGSLWLLQRGMPGGSPWGSGAQQTRPKASSGVASQICLHFCKLQECIWATPKGHILRHMTSSFPVTDFQMAGQLLLCSAITGPTPKWGQHF